MNKLISLNKNKVEYGYAVFFVAALMLMATVILMANPADAATFTPLTVQMGVGSTGVNVTNLQTFLASNSDIYPQAMVTGYYGGLTKAAVQQLQLAYGIQMLGNVGPSTFGRINSLIAKGYGIDIYGPTIYNKTIQKSSNSVTLAWNTTESALGKVYYSSSPFGVSEAVGNFSEPTITGGTSVSTTSMASSQSVTISNLQSGTLYYYIIEAVDASGNVSVTWPTTFITN